MSSQRPQAWPVNGIAEPRERDYPHNYHRAIHNGERFASSSGDSPNYNRSICNGDGYMGRNHSPVADVPPTYIPDHRLKHVSYNGMPPRPPIHVPRHMFPPRTANWLPGRGRPPYRPPMHLYMPQDRYPISSHSYSNTRGFFRGSIGRGFVDTLPAYDQDPRIQKFYNGNHLAWTKPSVDVGQINAEHSYCSKEIRSAGDNVKSECVPGGEMLSSIPRSIKELLNETSIKSTVFDRQSFLVVPLRAEWPVDISYQLDNVFRIDSEPGIGPSSSATGIEMSTTTFTMKQEPTVPLVNALQGSVSDLLSAMELQPEEFVKQEKNDFNFKDKGSKNTRRKRKPNPLRSFAVKRAKVNSNSQNGPSLSKEMKSLLATDPEILNSRSRGESLTLARRQMMESEMEQNEIERIQTSNEPIDEACNTDTTMEYAMSEMSESIKSDATPLSHDLGSSSHDQESISMLSIDSSVFNEFSPDLIARCKKLRVPATSGSGDTPLHKMCRRGRTDMASCLVVALKTNPNISDNAGWTPLHEACSHQHLDIVSMLLSNGADANSSASDGTRPIHDAIEAGSLPTVQALVKHGADLSVEISDKNLLEVARDADQTEIYEYLKPVMKAQQEKRAIKAPANPSTVPIRRRVRKKPEDEIRLPLSGYDKSSPGFASFGEEMDHPLFYICPVVEMSSKPMIPTYNFEICGGPNPRRHNFCCLSDLLRSLGMSEGELKQHCPKLRALQLSVGDILKQLDNPYYNISQSLRNSFKNLPKDLNIKFLPLCNELRRVLDIQVANLDD